VRAVDGATNSGVDRDRSGSGSRRCAGGLLAVGSCPGNAAADRVSWRTSAGACGERDGTEMQCDDNDGSQSGTCIFLLVQQ